MIPKVIHYCWFSNDQMPDNVLRCIESWRQFFPGWTFKLWGADSFDFDSVPFTREAYAAKKWAFVSDYVRLYALYTEGGVYLDSDVQAWHSIDSWLQYDFFTGLEMRDKEHTEVFPEAAIMGSVPRHPLVKQILDVYQDRHFRLQDGSYDMTPIPSLVKPILVARGWKPVDKTQFIDGGIAIFSTDEIANTNCPRTSSVRLYHLNNRSWIPLTTKEKIIRLMERWGILKYVKIITRR